LEVVAMGSDYEQMRAERDRLKMQLWESERLAAALEQERNRLKELRLVESEQREKMQDQRDRLAAELAEFERKRDITISALAREETERRRLTDLCEQLSAELERQRTVAADTYQVLRASNDELRLELVESERLRQEAFASCETMRQQVAELQAQLEAAAVTPAQQADGAAERLDKVRRLIGSVVGWYECTEFLQEINQAEAWEQARALLGRLQTEAG